MGRVYNKFRSSKIHLIDYRYVSDDIKYYFKKCECGQHTCCIGKPKTTSYRSLCGLSEHYKNKSLFKHFKLNKNNQLVHRTYKNTIVKVINIKDDSCSSILEEKNNIFISSIEEFNLLKNKNNDIKFKSSVNYAPPRIDILCFPNDWLEFFRKFPNDICKRCFNYYMRNELDFVPFKDGEEGLFILQTNKSVQSLVD